MEIKFVQTCGGCPEQYDAFDENGKLVGYLRLRHGHFRVDFPDIRGETIYEATPKGDGGFFPEEKEFYLEMAKKAIELKLKEVEMKKAREEKEYG